MRLLRQHTLRSEQIQEQWRANKRHQENEARERERREWEERLIKKENKIMEQIENRDRLEAHNKVVHMPQKTLPIVISGAVATLILLFIR